VPEIAEALLAFETCFRGGMVEGPATAGFVVCSADGGFFFICPVVAHT
jgi:hypothetical protein